MKDTPRRKQRDWLVSGREILASEGSGNLTIERLCARLKVTKGSFYHHFADMNAYKSHLLLFIEEESTLAVIAVVEAEATPHIKLERLLGITLQNVTAMEVTFRAWALQDEEVRAVQQRIDMRRIAYLDALFDDLVTEPQHAHLLAQMIYTLYIGSYHQLPPLSSAQLQLMYRACLQAFELL